MESMVLAERIVWQSSKRMGNPTDNIRGSIVRYIRLEICTDKYNNLFEIFLNLQ